MYEQRLQLMLREGPYAPAILRFRITFPPDHPTSPPCITFTSDIFHPLVAPLTTYTYSAGHSALDTVSATDDERLRPGEFSLRHEFSHWFGHSKSNALFSDNSSRNASGSRDQQRKALRDAIRPPPVGRSSPRSPSLSSPDISSTHAKPSSISEVLKYVKSTFDDESILDALPIEAAGNAGAWKAWRAFRKSAIQDINTLPIDLGTKSEDEWSWDGVWEERVRKGVIASTAESTLYAMTSGDDTVGQRNEVIVLQLTP